MKQQNQERYQLNIINYLAIDALGKIGNLMPTESEITSMEKALSLSINSTLKKYHKKSKDIIKTHIFCE